MTGSIYVGGFIGNAELLKLSVANSYNAGNVSGTGYVGSLAGLVNEYAKVAVEDFYYLNNGLGMNAEKYGNPVTLNQLNYGAVATLLRDGKNGSVWGQRVNVDLYPNFSGVLTDYFLLHCRPFGNFCAACLSYDGGGTEEQRG